MSNVKSSWTGLWRYWQTTHLEIKTHLHSVQVYLTRTVLSFARSVCFDCTLVKTNMKQFPLWNNAVSTLHWFNTLVWTMLKRFSGETVEIQASIFCCCLPVWLQSQSRIAKAPVSKVHVFGCWNMVLKVIQLFGYPNFSCHYKSKNLIMYNILR